MAPKLHIALAQMELVQGDPVQNGEKAAEWIAAAADAGADLLLLPELWASGYDLHQASQLAWDRDQGPFQALRNLSRSSSIAIGGSMLERGSKGIYNTFALYYSGDQAAYYQKIHLFRLFEEDRWLTGGKALVTAPTPWGKSGLAICYDLRFPEMFRAYAEMGVKIVLMSAVWPQRRIGHWKKLLQARAIENQFFIAAVNRAGIQDGEAMGGCSTVVSPMGEPLLEMHDQEALLQLEIDLEEVEKTRQWMPVLEDRRTDIYGSYREKIDDRSMD